jgi:glutamyl-tRNA synthetase
MTVGPDPASAVVGRFAPSPSGDLHLGNLRTATVAYLLARSMGGRFVLRIDDLDPVATKPGVAESQHRDLAALGLDFDGEPMWQSQRGEAHRAALASLVESDLTYPCFCTRAEIQQAASAPHAPPGSYPGTCRNLSAAQRQQWSDGGRRSALRLRSQHIHGHFIDLIAGEVTAEIDDVVLQRTDGVIAYNLACVVDDAAQGVTQVCRGDDLMSSTPRQLHLIELLDYPDPAYAHVPLALSTRGVRLAKRDGAVTLSDRIALGESVDGVRSMLAHSLGLSERNELVSMSDLVVRFDVSRLTRAPWVYSPDPHA